MLGGELRSPEGFLSFIRQNLSRLTQDKGALVVSCSTGCYPIPCAAHVTQCSVICPNIVCHNRTAPEAYDQGLQGNQVPHMYHGGLFWCKLDPTSSITVCTSAQGTQCSNTVNQSNSKKQEHCWQLYLHPTGGGCLQTGTRSPAQ